MFAMSVERHVTDGDLIGILDGEPDAARAGAHVDTCAACTARLALLHQRSARFGDVLRRVEYPMVDRTRFLPGTAAVERAHMRARRRAVWSRPGIRAAAGVLLLAGVGAASPARGWILDRVTGRRVEPASRAPLVTGRTRARAPDGAGSIVRFVPDSDELVVRFDVRPMAGSLTIATGDDLRSSAQIISGARGEAFLVLPSELRIRNASGSLADYQVTLSPTVRRLRVQFGDAGSLPIATIDVTPGMRHIIQLGSRAGGQ